MVSWVFTELDETGSTQAVAKGLATMGSPEGTCVVAKAQTSGVGRHGRTWASPTGGLYMSFILRPTNIPRPEVVTLVSAASIVDGLEASTGISAKIRWPNDVVVGQSKLAGTIADAQFEKKDLSGLIVGVGVNCNTPVRHLQETGGGATSLSEELGKEVVIGEIKAAVLDSFSALYARWQAGEDMFPVWQARLGTVGKTVAVKMKTDETAFSYQATGLDPDGGLVVYRDGETRVLHPEDVDLLREE